jgi:hypothetical protein
MQQQIDFEKFRQKPVENVMEMQASTLIGHRDTYKTIRLNLQRNIHELKDWIFELGTLSDSGLFYSVSSRVELEQVGETNTRLLYRNIYELDKVGLMHERTVYGFLSMIGDLGGVIEIIMLLFGFFMFPISEFSFNVKAMKKWFLARTRDQNLLKASEEHLVDNEDFKVPESQREEIEKHQKINVRFKDQLRLYFYRMGKYWRCFRCCWKCWGNKEKLDRLYEEGAKKIALNLDIKLIVQKLRTIDILLENSLMND